MFNYGLDQYTEAVIQERRREVEGIRYRKSALNVLSLTRWQAIRLGWQHLAAQALRMFARPRVARRLGS